MHLAVVKSAVGIQIYGSAWHHPGICIWPFLVQGPLPFQTGIFCQKLLFLTNMAQCKLSKNKILYSFSFTYYTYNH